MEYKEMNDYELLYMINEESEEAYNIIFNKYRGMVIKQARKYNNTKMNIGIDINDLILEGYIGIDKSIKRFKDTYKFQNFVFLCIERQMIGLIRKLTTKKNCPLNNSFSYDENIDDDTTILSLLEDKTAINPEHSLMLNEESDEDYKKVSKKLKGIELQVFNLKRNNLSISEISIILKKDKKIINNAINRIRNKKKQLNIIDF